MDEEMEMEEEIIQVYDVFEIDFDYEFDATRFFDFTRPESEAESRFSESWFSRAPDYPPSPFVAQLFPLNGLRSPNVDVSPKSKYNDRLSNDDGNASIDQHAEYCDQDEACRDSSQALLRKLYDGNFLNSQNQAKCSHGGPRGLTFFNHLAHDNVKTKPKSLAKPYMRKTSTLMKPTASQLSKQNQQHQVCGSSRLQKNEGNSGTHSGMESQASKRQKLDGGHLCRIVEMKQPVNLTHKLPKKDAAAQGLNSQAKLRITIPREPDLATAHRAERIRLTSTKETENPTATTYRFKARTLNRKTLEAPVLPFSKRTTQHLPDIKASHLKPTGRTNPSTSTDASPSVCRNDKVLNKVHADSGIETGNKDGKGSDSVDIPRVAVRQVVHSFKARPLDRKILASRGDIGVFRNNKRDVTVPKEFMFQTSKRTQPNLPTELFSKLSLAGEPHSKNCAQVELPQNTTISAKESKENRWESCHLNKQNTIHLAKEKLDARNGKEQLTVANGRIGEINPRSGMSRPLGSRRQQ
ncbi:protein TPX2 isoform X2 [Chenopodium quinoa]|uniref:protein TPX2 isoform X2 n=1 Tax=Chenopodium quinoa TaxID=63459 RepID=UPI000B7757CE|nr:protein TPX2 isoform X2 [Chenopodium quinoa]